MTVNLTRIYTRLGDGGETHLGDMSRVPKTHPRIEAYGTVDELNSSLGFARSICEDSEIAAFTKGVQQDLFKIGSSLATPTESPKPQIDIATTYSGLIVPFVDVSPLLPSA